MRRKSTPDQKKHHHKKHKNTNTKTQKQPHHFIASEEERNSIVSSMARSTTKSSSRNSGNRSNNSNNSKPRANSRLSQQAQQHQRDPGGIKLETFWGLGCFVYTGKSALQTSHPSPSRTLLDKAGGFLMANWWWAWGKLAVLETSCFLGQVRTWDWVSWGQGASNRWDFAALASPSTSRKLKGFTTKRGQWPQILWENIRLFMFVTEPFCPERPAIFWGTRKACCEAPKHTMDDFFWRNRKVEIVGDLDLYQLPSMICMIRKNIFHRSKAGGSLLARDPNTGG